jgi:hypothetical protein
LEKDLIIAAASNYDWNKLQYWVNSIRKTGFTGDVAIVGTNMTKETIDKLTAHGVILSLYGKQQENGDVVAHSNGVPHVERFFYLWNFLNSTKEDYRYVITTDSRDVIFQSNPSEWLENALVFHSVVASSEGLRYNKEPWGNQNLLDTFGPYFHDRLKDTFINNVGVIAGDLEHIKGLLLFIFQMSINRSIPIVDQAVYNFILQTPPFFNDTFFTTNDDGWAVNLGTSIDAVKAGSGDIGARCHENATEFAKYTLSYEDTQPVITDDGIVKNKHGSPFIIVHQWDRIPTLKAKFENIYGEAECSSEKTQSISLLTN